MIALLYDIHGNDHALEAVIADATEEGADAWVLGGDYCLMGAQPSAVLDRLESLPADTIWLSGNTERWVAHPDAKDIPLEAIRDAALFVKDAIGTKSVKELNALPNVLADVPFDGAAGTVFCHASPGSDMLGFTDQPADTDADAVKTKVDAKTIVCGHTHIQFERDVDGVRIVNPGSVGLPFDGDRSAAYGILYPDGSFHLKRVEYDIELALNEYEVLSGEWTEIAHRRLVNARY